MRLAPVIAALAALLPAAAPALADAPAAGFGRRHVVAHRHHAPVRHFGHAPRHHHGGYRAVGAPPFGPLPRFFYGTGDGAAHLHSTPVQMTLYREAYIGRGLIYNTPPTLDVPGPGPVLSVRY